MLGSISWINVIHDCKSNSESIIIINDNAKEIIILVAKNQIIVFAFFWVVTLISVSKEYVVTWIKTDDKIKDKIFVKSDSSNEDDLLNPKTNEENRSTDKEYINWTTTLAETLTINLDK